MRTLIGVMSLGLLVAPAVFPRQPAPPDPQAKMIESIRKAVASLPNYGVYDYLAFRLDGSDVTLQGFAQTRTLESDALHAVERVKGVGKVIDQVQTLPASRMDDRIRWAVFARIYGQPSLSRYAAGGGLMAHDPFLRPPLGWADTPSTTWEPPGNYAIHIIVDNGNVELLGLVSSKMDKDIAGLVASQVAGVFAVENHIGIG